TEHHSYPTRRSSELEEEGHGTHDGLDRRAGRQGEGVQSLVQRGASGRAPENTRLLERRALRGGQGLAEASRRLRARERRRARVRSEEHTSELQSRVD